MPMAVLCHHIVCNSFVAHICENREMIVQASREEQLLGLQMQASSNRVAGAKVRTIFLTHARGRILAAVVAVVPIAAGLPPAAIPRSCSRSPEADAFMMCATGALCMCERVPAVREVAVNPWRQITHRRAMHTDHPGCRPALKSGGAKPMAMQPRSPASLTVISK